MEILIESVTGARHTVKVSKTATVSELKQAICDRIGIPAHYQVTSNIYNVARLLFTRSAFDVGDKSFFTIHNVHGMDTVVLCRLPIAWLCLRLQI